MEKITIAKQYANIIAKVEGVLTADEVKFLEERKALHEKKNASRKPTKVQEENEVIKTKILEGMAVNRAYTITDLIKSISAISDLTNQRVSAIVRQMVVDGKVVRTEERGKAYFTKA